MQDRTIDNALLALRKRIILTNGDGLGQVEALKTEWESRAANLLKAELKRKAVTYAQLAERIGDKEVNVRNKLSRGKFSAAFLIEALHAIGVTAVRLD